MAITTSAKKALRVSNRKHAFNVRRDRAMKDVIKEIRTLATSKKGKEAAALLPKAYQAIDKASKSNFITKQAGSRYKSRISALVKKVTA